MGDKLNLYVFKRQPNSATAEACDVEYKEDWQTRSGTENPIGNVQCGGTSYQLIRSTCSKAPDPKQMRLFIKLGEDDWKTAPESHFTSSSGVVVVAAIEQNQVNFSIDAIDRALAGARSYFEVQRKPEVGQSVNERIETTKGAYIRLGAGGAYSRGKETSTLPEGFEYDPEYPFSAYGLSLKAQASGSLVNRYLDFLHLTGNYDQLFGKVNDHYTAVSGDNGEWNTTRYGLGLSVEGSTKRFGWTNATDLYVGYYNPFVWGGANCTGRWAYRTLPRPEKFDISDSSFLDFKRDHEFYAGISADKLGDLGIQIFLQSGQDINNEENKKGPRVNSHSFGVRLIWSPQESETKFTTKSTQGDSTVTLATAKEPTILPAPPPLSPASAGQGATAAEPAPAAEAAPATDEAPPAGTPPSSPAPTFTEMGGIINMPQSKGRAEEFFDSGSDKLRAGADAAVENLVGDVVNYTTFLKSIGTDAATVKISIYAHADSQGSMTYNQDLSDRRAETVRKAFEEKIADSGGLDGFTFEYKSKGYGETQPIGYACNKEENILSCSASLMAIEIDTTQNREVEFKEFRTRNDDGTLGEKLKNYKEAKDSHYGIIELGGARNKMFYAEDLRETRRVEAETRAEIPAFAGLEGTQPPVEPSTVEQINFYTLPMANSAIDEATVSKILGFAILFDKDYKYANDEIVIVTSLKTPNDEQLRYLAAAVMSKVFMPVRVLKQEGTVENEGIVIGLVPEGKDLTEIVRRAWADALKK